MIMTIICTSFNTDLLNHIGSDIKSWIILISCVTLDSSFPWQILSRQYITWTFFDIDDRWLLYHTSPASHHWFDSNDIDIRREEILQANINLWCIPRKSKTDTTRTIISTFSMKSNRVNWRWWNSMKQSISDDKLDSWKRYIRLSMSRIIFVFTTEDIVHMQCDFGTFWRWFCRKRVCIRIKLMSKQNYVFSESEFVSQYLKPMNWERFSFISGITFPRIVGHRSVNS